MGIDSETQFQTYAVDETWYAVDAEPVTPGTPLSAPCRALWIGGAGSITVVMRSERTATYGGILAGTLLPISVSEVTSATASNITAMF